jgi:hypothetical protein
VNAERKREREESESESKCSGLRRKGTKEKKKAGIIRRAEGELSTTRARGEAAAQENTSYGIMIARTVCDAVFGGELPSDLGSAVPYYWVRCDFDQRLRELRKAVSRRLSE